MSTQTGSAAPEIEVRRPVEPDDVSAGGPDERRRFARPVTWLLSAAGTVALFGWLYLLTLRANAANVTSDGATVILQGKSIASGNVLLHGWHLSLDSWWTLDVAFYTVATAMVGIRPALLLVVPAIIATLVVLAGVVLARRGRRGWRDPAALGGAAVVVAVLALPAHELAVEFICGPIHVSTALYALVAFIGMRRNRFGPGWVVAVVFLAAGLLGDLQIAAYGVAPVLLSGLVAIRRRRSLRAGAVPVAASIASVGLAIGVRAVVDVFGGFKIGAANSLANSHQILANIASLPSYLAQMLGVVHGGYGDAGVPLALQAVHVVAAALLLGCFVVGVGHLLKGLRRGAVREEDAASGGPGEPEPWRLDDVLVFASVASIVVFVLLARTTSVTYQRYLTAAVIFSTVLAARAVTRWFASGPRPAVRRRAVALGTAAVVCFAAAGVVQVSQPVPAEPTSGLVTYLEAHHLTLGIGDFWLASISTVESGGKVVIRPVVPVVPTASGKLTAYRKGDVTPWFDGVAFQFLAYSGDGNSGVAMSTAVETWGPPSHVYVYAGYYHILVWPHPLRITPGGPPPGPR